MLLSEATEKMLMNLVVTRNISWNTNHGLHWRLEKFIEWCGDINIQELTLKKIEEYRLFLFYKKKENGLAAMTVVSINHYMKAIRSILRYCIEEGLSVVLPQKIKLAKTVYKERAYLSVEEINLLISAVKGNGLTAKRDRAILSTLFSTGLRVSELVSLNRNVINFEKNEFTVIGKGRKPRIVFLDPVACEYLKTYLEQRTDDFRPLFIGYHCFRKNLHDEEKRRLGRHAVNTIVRKYAKRASLDKKVTAHVLRHSFATALLSNGAPIRSVSEMLGHTSVSTTMIYTHLTNIHLAQVHQKYLR